MAITYCEISYLTPKRRPSRVVYRWGTRWESKAKSLESRGCTITEVRVLDGKTWKTIQR